MPTVRYVDPVNGPYLTPLEAFNAAADGDTMVLAEGFYDTGFLTLTGKLVHIKGDTEDPALVQLSPRWRLGQGLNPATRFIEGVTFGNSTAGSELFLDGPTFINRCRFHTSGGTYGGVQSDSANATLRMEQCYTRVSTNDYLIRNFQPGSVEIVKTETVRGLTANELIQCPSPDIVTTPTAGYGPAYGGWYFDQWTDNAFRLYGTIGENLPPEIDKSQIQLRILRETPAGEIERIPWMVTRPHTITGAFDLPYLPTDHVYWVEGILEGYRPLIDGPFIPGQT